MANVRVPVAAARRCVFLACALALLGLFGFGRAASAADVRTGDDVTVAATEQVTDSLYTAANTTTVAGRVSGDVIATGEKLDITGRVDGGVNALVKTADISGIVGGSVRVGGADVTISGQVGGDVLVASGTLTIAATGSVSGDVLLESGTLKVNGPVRGSIKGHASTVDINAPVGGDVDVVVRNLNLGAASRIAGVLHYTSADSASVAPGAVTTGGTTHVESTRFYPGTNVLAWLFSPLFRLLAMLVSGVVFVIVFPGFASAGADGIRRSPIWSLVAGVAIAILAPISIVVLFATVVGLPIALLGLFFFVGVLYLSQVFAGLAIGRLILPKSWDVRSRGYNLLAMAIGVVAIGAVRQIPAPYLGGVIDLIIGILALGGVMVAAQTARRRGAA